MRPHPCCPPPRHGARRLLVVALVALGLPRSTLTSCAFLVKTPAVPEGQGEPADHRGAEEPRWPRRRRPSRPPTSIRTAAARSSPTRRARAPPGSPGSARVPGLAGDVRPGAGHVGRTGHTDQTAGHGPDQARTRPGPSLGQIERLTLRGRSDICSAAEVVLGKGAVAANFGSTPNSAQVVLTSARR